MKNVRNIIGVAVFAAAGFGAFAFSPAPAKTTAKPAATAEFYMVGGVPTSQVDPAHPCDNTNSTLCSRRYNINSSGQPTSQVPGSDKNGPRL